MKHLLLLLLAPVAFGQVLVDTSKGVVYAHNDRVQLVKGWSVPGLKNPTKIVAASDRVAVLDAIHNEALIVELGTGLSQHVVTPETPIDAAFLNDDLYILARDARMLQHVGKGAVTVSADPAFVRTSKGSLYVYSRATGTLEEVRNDRVTRSAVVAPYASDMEIAGDVAYLTFPRDARIRAVDLDTMTVADNVVIGAVPVDLAFGRPATALTARTLIVADPSAKRVWLTEGNQTTTQAFLRGFLRGFLGLGLYGKRASQFPTGIDRVMTRENVWVAYDSSSGTLYRFTKSKSSVVAKDVPPNGFAITSDGIAYWKDDGISVAQGSGR
jgi:hypothetical protein